jgi:hypothetical protein
MFVRSRLLRWPFLVAVLAGTMTGNGLAAEAPVVGLVPKARKPIVLDGKLDDWDGAFVTPVHVGHPDFPNRGAHFLFLWDEQNLYVGLRCLDRKPAHVAPDTRLWDGDAVELYLDARRGDKLGGKDFGPGTLHMFYTAFTGTAVKPRWRVRDLPAFRGLALKGVEVAAVKAPWGYTAELKLPWANFPGFKARAGEVIGLDAELCSSDGGPRVDRTWVYSSPAAVATPSVFGRVKLVEGIDSAKLQPYSRALLPVSVTQTGNYPWLHTTTCVSPTLEKATAKVEGKVLDASGKARKTTTLTRRALDSTGFVLWNGSLELFDLAPGAYTLELSARDRAGNVLARRTTRIVHGDALPARAAASPAPMVERTRPHPRLKEERPKGRRAKLSIGTLFMPEKLPLKGKAPLFVHFHGAPWLPEVAAAREGRAVISVHLGSGSAVYGKAFAEAKAFTKLIGEAEAKAGVGFEPVGLTAWSAGYGAVRAILRSPEHYRRVQFVILLDGLHAGYVDGRPGPRESRLVAEDLDVFVRLARDAVAGRKRFLVVHSEIFPGNYASTTETADYLLDAVGLRRSAVLKWGPGKTQQLSDTRRGGLRVAGFAGNSAPDHVDLFHALPDFLGWLASTAPSRPSLPPPNESRSAATH